MIKGIKLTRTLHLNYQMEQLFSKMNIFFFTPPDPGFYQQISDTECEIEGDLVNFDEEIATKICSDDSGERNPFTIHEAIEESGLESDFEQQIEISRRKSRKERIMKSTEQSTSIGEETPTQQIYKHSCKRRRFYLIESGSDWYLKCINVHNIIIDTSSIVEFKCCLFNLQ